MARVWNARAPLSHPTGLVLLIVFTTVVTAMMVSIAVIGVIATVTSTTLMAAMVAAPSMVPTASMIPTAPVVTAALVVTTAPMIPTAPMVAAALVVTTASMIPTASMVTAALVVTTAPMVAMATAATVTIIVIRTAVAMVTAMASVATTVMASVATMTAVTAVTAMAASIIIIVVVVVVVVVGRRIEIAASGRRVVASVVSENLSRGRNHVANGSGSSILLTELFQRLQRTGRKGGLAGVFRLLPPFGGREELSFGRQGPGEERRAADKHQSRCFYAIHGDDPSKTGNEYSPWASRILPCARGFIDGSQ